ncbi:uncharacterized protein G2W53_028961 [Senna tora]|uniref:Uncharacterized protein n=1 Tax=Senna tora TaxID=362788 RepID=A0A834T4A8_9FABA|nr:uncharacterized protein G2W53_028961 [Senna tora]
MALHQALSEDGQTIKLAKRYKSAAVPKLKNITPVICWSNQEPNDPGRMWKENKEVVGRSIKRALLTPIQVRNIQSHSIRFKSQGMKYRNFGIGETSRPLILNPRNKASSP